MQGKRQYAERCASNDRPNYIKDRLSNSYTLSNNEYDSLSEHPLAFLCLPKHSKQDGLIKPRSNINNKSSSLP